MIVASKERARRRRLVPQPQGPQRAVVPGRHAGLPRETWRELPDGAERGRVWDFMVGVYPPYRDYQAATQRRIPIVMMSAIEPIEVFKA